MPVKKLTYYEKLKDPRWQKKRLEVMEHWDFSCELCGDSTSTLNVHHKEYFKNREPWDYQKEQLSCLCEECHESLHERGDILKLVCSYARLDGPENREELAILLAGYMGIDKDTFFSNNPELAYPYNLTVFKAGKSANRTVFLDGLKKSKAAKKALE